MTTKEIEAFRNDTPACLSLIHLNNAGASLMPLSVLETIKTYLDLEAEIGGYEAADVKSDEIEAFYSESARLLNCKAHNMAFTANATDSFARAISSIPFEPGDVILTSRDDYISNQIVFLSLIKRFKIRLIRIEDLPEGGMDLSSAAKLIDLHRPKLVAATHIPTNSGLIQPVELLGEICSETDTLYLVDACQSIGQLPLDVQTIKCDFLSVTCRKFLRGPRGAGFLYVSDKVLKLNLEPLLLDMRGARWIEKDRYELFDGARRFEDWEFAYALLLGSREAISYCMRIGVNNISDRTRHLAQYLRDKVNGFRGMRTMDKGKDLAGIVSIEMDHQDPYRLRDALRAKRFNTSLSFRESAILDFDSKGIHWTLRASPHYYNTEEEIDAFTEELSHMINPS